MKKTIIKKSASIGANVTLICGNTIGRYSLIGAGSVVTKNVPDFALVVGNPGKIVGWVNRRGKKLVFEKDGKSLCRKYFFEKNIVREL